METFSPPGEGQGKAPDQARAGEVSILAKAEDGQQVFQPPTQKMNSGRANKMWMHFRIYI